MSKIQTLETYLDAHDFLREIADFHRELDEQFSAIQPLNFPPREKILELVKDGVPLLQRENFQRQILDATKSFVPYKLAEKLLQQDNQSAEKFFSEHEDLNKTLTRKIFWTAVDKLVLAELKRWERDDWQKNYCPICGRRPTMAQLKKFNDGRARYLLCGGCHTLWNWHRLGCPYCGNENLERIHILELDSKMRLDVCDECNCYLKTYSAEDEEDIYLRDWTTLHLDLMAEEKNLRKCGAVELE